MRLRGWIELDGRVLSREEIARILAAEPALALRFGGEFLLTWDGCTARDWFGVMPGDVPPGTVRCGMREDRIEPTGDGGRDLERAIVTAVGLRNGEGVTSLSGGLDSALVAKLAGLPCIAAGVEGSHDLAQARDAAEAMGLSCEYVVLTGEMITEALETVVRAIPGISALHAGIAIPQYWVCSRARTLGHGRVLSGQGADELFGGYARYLSSPDLAAGLSRDLAALPVQIARDQAVAGLSGVYYSLPYLDRRVVRAARSMPASELVSGGVRKRPLRLVAERHIPPGIAWKEKKAMQYGSGVWKVLQGIARDNGYKRSVQRYIDQLASQ